MIVKGATGSQCVNQGSIKWTNGITDKALQFLRKESDRKWPGCWDLSEGRQGLQIYPQQIANRNLRREIRRDPVDPSVRPAIVIYIIKDLTGMLSGNQIDDLKC